MSGSRRLSQAISEGDGISLIAFVDSAEAAQAAEQAGAEGILLGEPPGAVRDSTNLPILCRREVPPTEAEAGGADAWIVSVRDAGDEEGVIEGLHANVLALGLEPVVEVRDEEELALALERVDPEIFLLSGEPADEGEDALDRVLELLPDIPAGKLAIASVELTTRDEVVALERAGIDGVLVDAERVAALAGGLPPEV